MMALKKILAIITMLFGTVAITCACRQESTSSNAVQNELMPGIDFALKDGVKMVETENAQKVWLVVSREATYSMETKKLLLQPVEAYFYQDKKPAYKVVGDDGEYDENTRVLDIQGNVIVTGINDGYILRTDALEYSFRSRIATTESPVEIEGDGLSVKGVGMEASVDDDTVNIKKDVKVNMLPDAMRRKQEIPK